MESAPAFSSRQVVSILGPLCAFSGLVSVESRYRISSIDAWGDEWGLAIATCNPGTTTTTSSRRFHLEQTISPFSYVHDVESMPIKPRCRCRAKKQDRRRQASPMYSLSERKELFSALVQLAV